MSFFSRSIILTIFFLSYFGLTQSEEDLEFLDMLPETQRESISSKLGIQTGKPIVDEVRMDDFEKPSFDSSRPKILSDNLLNETNFYLPDSNRIFGLDLFKDAPSTFAPIDLAPAH